MCPGEGVCPGEGMCVLVSVLYSRPRLYYSE